MTMKNERKHIMDYVKDMKVTDWVLFQYIRMWLSDIHNELKLKVSKLEG